MVRRFLVACAFPLAVIAQILFVPAPSPLAAGSPAASRFALSNQAIHRSRSSCQTAFADRCARSGARVAWDTSIGTPQSVRGSCLQEIVSASVSRSLHTPSPRDLTNTAYKVMRGVAPLYGMHDVTAELAVASIEPDHLGHRHVRLRQMHRGMRVIGGDLILHFDARTNLYEVNGRYVADIAADTTPLLPANEAESRAVTALHGAGGTLLDACATHKPVVCAYNMPPRLAHEVRVVSRDNPRQLRWLCYIDAMDGTVLLHHSTIKTIAPPTANGTHTPVSGATLSGEGGHMTSVTGWHENANAAYYLLDTNTRWTVCNAAPDGYEDSLTYAHRMTNEWGGSDPAELSAAANFSRVQEYYAAAHGRASFDNAGSMAYANVHEGIIYNNAYWDGTDFHFGDGDGLHAAPLAVLDVVGHEFTHAVIDYTSGLVYSDEPGALSESFADIMGTLAEFYAQPDERDEYPSSPPGTADWLCGEDCSVMHDAQRDMRAPDNAETVGLGNEQPSRYLGTHWDFSGDFHRNSGVQNFFFHLLAEGGSGTNDGFPFAVAGIGITNAGMVAYRTMTLYCTPSTDYRAARDAWVSAAEDLNPSWALSVRASWAAAGIGMHSLSANGPISFRCVAGGAISPSTFTVVISNNDASASMPWTLSSADEWLRVMPAGGVVAARGTTTASITPAPAARGFAAGSYTTLLTFATMAPADAVDIVAILDVAPQANIAEPLDANPGWAHDGEWAFGAPKGLGSAVDGFPDPAAAASGSNVFGINLDGDYAIIVSGPWHLVAGPFDLSAHSATSLRYKRWLNADCPPYVSVGIELSTNGTDWSAIWSNDRFTITDDAWQDCVHDVAALADGQPAVYVRWSHAVGSVNAYAMSGWNIDDIEFTGTVIDGLVVGPESGYVAAGPAGGPFSPAAASYIVSNTGLSALMWSAQSTCPWLTVTPSSGSLAANGSAIVAIALNAAALSMPTGLHGGSIVFSNAVSGHVSSRPCFLDVASIPGDIDAVDSIGNATDRLMTFGPLAASLKTTEFLVVTNRNDAHPLTILGIGAPTSGTFAVSGMPVSFPTVLAARAAIRLEVAFSPATPGSHAETIAISSDDTNEPLVFVSLEGTCIADTLAVTPEAGFAPTGPYGGPFTPSTTLYALSNTTPSALTWSAHYGAPWLNVAPASGTLAARSRIIVTAGVSAAAHVLGSGMYRDRIVISNHITGATHARAVTLDIEPVSSLPFTEDFESGSLSNYWHVSGTFTHRARIMQDWTPHGGTNHLVLDSSAQNGMYARNELTLTVDLENKEHVVLSFWAASLNDESDGPPTSPFVGGADFDGVAISADGVIWHEVQALRSLGGYSNFTVDLDAAALLHGIAYTRLFRIRFNHYDNHPAPNDGIAIDDIAIVGDTQGSMRVSPADAFVAKGTRGGPFSPASAAYLVSNASDSAFTWTAVWAAAWLRVTPSSGTLAPATTIGATIGLTSNALALPPGIHEATVAFSNRANGAVQLRSARLTIDYVASVPFAETFDSGSLTTCWHTSGTYSNRIAVTSQWSPHAGAYHVVMDNAANDGQFARNELTLAINLLGHQNVALSFWAAGLGEDSDWPPESPFVGGADFDGVAVSADGVVWHEVQGLRSLGAYQRFSVNLDDAVAAAGIPYTNRFLVRFNQYDNYAANADGIALDDISIVGDVADSIKVSPQSMFDAIGDMGGPFAPASKQYVLTNHGASPTSWSASTSASWLDVSPVAGSLVPGSATTLVVSVASPASSLGTGTFACVVTVSNGMSGYAVQRTATLQVMRPRIWRMAGDNDPHWVMEGRWEFGVPLGIDGDPSTAFTGSNVFGYNLAGTYDNDMTQTWYLTSLPINLERFKDLELSFRRWLGVEGPLYDHATIEASADGLQWLTIWTNSTHTIADTNWMDITCELPQSIDTQRTAYVRWGMGVTDDIIALCGWNLDDLAFRGTPIDTLGVTPDDLWIPYACTGVLFRSASTVYLLTNTGKSNITWAVQSTEPWLAIEPASGIIPPGSMQMATASLALAAGNLAPGFHPASLAFTNCSGGILQQRPVHLTVDVPVSIAQARRKANGALSAVGPAIVTITNTIGTAGHAWCIQDDSGGLVLFDPSADRACAVIASNNIKPGTRIVVTGSNFWHHGLHRFEDIVVIASQGTGSVPSPLVIDIEDFQDAAPTGELCESMLVRIDNARFADYGTFSTGQYAISKRGLASTVLVPSDSPLLGSPIPSNRCTIVGVMSQHAATTPGTNDTTGYHLAALEGIACPPSIGHMVVTSSYPLLSHDVAAVVVAGTNDDQIAGSMSWSNSCNGLCGPITPGQVWSASVPLCEGTNMIVVTGRSYDDIPASDTAIVVRAGIGTGLPSIAITNHPIVVPNDQFTCTLAGTNNHHAFGSIWWSNTLDGAAGSVAVSGGVFVVYDVPLGVGTNTLVVSCSNLWDVVGSDSATVIRAGIGTGTPFVDITNDNHTVTFDTHTATIDGSNNAHVVGSLRWTNELNGACGCAPVSSFQFQVSTIPLSVGQNIIAVHATNAWGIASSDSVLITRGGIGTGIPFIDITSMPAIVSHDATAISLHGTNNPHVAGGLWWTNLHNGTHGTAQVSSVEFQVSTIPLSVGSNTIVVSCTNAHGIATNDCVTMVRGPIGTGMPCVDITNAIVAFDATAVSIVGTNNQHVAGMITWTNILNGAAGSLPVSSDSFTVPRIPLAVGDNVIVLRGTNLWHWLAEDTISIVRGPQGIGAPSLDPILPASVREYQVLLRRITGTSNIASIACNANTVNGRWHFDTNTWTFSCIPALGTDGATWHVPFIAANQEGVSTQILLIAVDTRADWVNPAHPYDFEDEDGDILCFRYTGAPREGSTIIFDGQNAVVSNACLDGSLSFAIRPRDDGDGMFTLRSLAFDNHMRNAILKGNILGVTSPGYAVRSLRFASQQCVVSNITLARAKAIVLNKGDLVGIVAISNGFDTLVADRIIGAQIRAGVPDGAACSNTPATASIKTVKARVIVDSSIAARDADKKGRAVPPQIKVRSAANSFLYRTTASNDVIETAIQGI